MPVLSRPLAGAELGAGGIYERRQGELLHPTHEPAEVLSELNKSMGSYSFSAQYQQSPIPHGGRIIKHKWLTRYQPLSREPRDRILISWDIALSEVEAGDYLPDLQKSPCALAPVAFSRAGHLSFAADAARLARPDEARMRAMIRCGENSLAIYCLGVLLSFMGFVILSQFSSTIAMQVVISIAGIALMIAAATLMTWTSNRTDLGQSCFEGAAPEQVPARP
jgi:hypothetical protein